MNSGGYLSFVTDVGDPQRAIRTGLAGENLVARLKAEIQTA